MPAPSQEVLAVKVVAWSEKAVSPTDPVLIETCASVIDYVSQLPIVADRDQALSWPPSATRAAVMMAARIYRRRSSPSGMSLLGAEGTVAYAARTDPDVATLLQLTRPAIG